MQSPTPLLPADCPAHEPFPQDDDIQHDDIEDIAANSEDEHGAGSLSPLGHAAQETLELAFEERLRKRGLLIRRMAKDGNCLFRSLADRIYGDAEMHDVVRRLCMDHVEREREHFSAYITQDFAAYVARKRHDRVFGNHLEIQAASEIYNRRIHVYDDSSDEPINAFSAPAPPDGVRAAPLRLTYHGRSHYNALVDPAAPDVGLGLGLPGYRPGLADDMQMDQALGESDAAALDDQILRSELKTAGAAGAARTAADDGGAEEMLQRALEASLAPHMAPCTGAEAIAAASGPHTPRKVYGGAYAGGFVGGAGGAGARAPHDGATCATAGPSADAASSSAAAVAPAAILQLLVDMGFSLPRAVAAHDQFGDELESSLEFLTRGD